MSIPANHITGYIQGLTNEWLEEEFVILLEALGVDTVSPPQSVLWAIQLIRLAEKERVEFRAPLLCEDLGVGWSRGPSGEMLQPSEALSAWIVYIRREIEIYTCAIKQRGPKAKAPAPLIRNEGAWVRLAYDHVVHVLEGDDHCQDALLTSPVS